MSSQHPIVKTIKEHLNIEIIPCYTDHGINITSRGEELVKVEYYDAVKNYHPYAGEFGSGAYDDGLTAAKELINENYSNNIVKIVLGYPTLVCDILPPDETTVNQLLEKYA